MCGNSFLFLNRDINQDRTMIERMLKYYKDTKESYQVLLFPEGTDRGERAVRFCQVLQKTHCRQRSVMHTRIQTNWIDMTTHCIHGQLDSI